MRFGIVYYGAQPKDRDLDQLAQTLRQMDHKVVIVTRCRRKGQPVIEFNGTPVEEQPHSPSWFNHLISIPLPFNFLWTRWIKKLALKHIWDAIFVRETPLSKHGLTIGRKLRLPVFLDMRENLVHMYSLGQKKRWFRKIVRPIGLVKRYEASVCPKFDHIFTVSDEVGKYVEEEYHVDASKISTLGNFPSSVFLKSLDDILIHKKRTELQQPVRLIHTGNITKIRGLQDFVDALKILVSREVSVILKIIGDGPYLETLKQQVQRLELEDHIEFIPMLPPEKVPEAVLSGDIGVCAYLLSPFTHQTLPGKLFEYMAAGLPVISSARKPVIRIVEKEKCGVIYYSREPSVIADAIEEMIRKPNETTKMGQNGREAIKSTYNQEYNSKVLSKVIQKHLEERGH